MSETSSFTAPAELEPERPVAVKRFLAPMFTLRQRRTYIFLVVCWGGALLWFWTWWLNPAHFISWPVFLFVTVPFLWLSALQLFFVYVLMQAVRSVASDPEPGQWRVAMIVTKTPSEPFEVIEPTLRAMLAQEYPHDTWLADEDPSPDTIRWCAANGVFISSRKGKAEYHQPVWPRRTRCKEGNLAFFYDHWGYRDYDIVSQLDADHVPQSGYLREILRPFADPEVGYVSAPSICSANAKESWAARTRLHTEAAFHGLFQTGYSKAFAPMCIGSHYAVRTRALEKVGGLGPDLAEDHSTTMILNAGGWRGVHAIDAIALGDGPATIADMVTQEFQWSRSLMTLLLSHTGRYLQSLPLRLKFLFLFCQSIYVMFALTSLMLYLVPVIAILADVRFANVTYPGFVLHAAPQAIVLGLIAWRIKVEGHFRPVDAPLISWEKALFLLLQWPWALWGCLMAIKDRVTGKFVDFRITPKGKDAQVHLPIRVLGVYCVLALGAILPVLFAENLRNAQGFLLLSLLNATLYTVIVVVIVAHHFRQNKHGFKWMPVPALLQFMLTLVVVGSLATGFVTRGAEGLYALAFGLEPLRLVRVEYGFSGAGYQAGANVKFRWDPHFN